MLSTKLKTLQRGLVYGVTAAGLLVGSSMASASLRTFEIDLTCNYPLIGVQPLTINGEADIPDIFYTNEEFPIYEIDVVATLKGLTWTGMNIVQGRTIQGISFLPIQIVVPNRIDDIIVETPILEQDIPLEDGDFTLNIFALSPDIEPLSNDNIGGGEIFIGDTMTLDILVKKADESPVIFAESDPDTGWFPVDCIADPTSDFSLGIAEVQARVIDQEIEVSPSTIDFGDLDDGESATESVTITNTGGEDLVISSITVDGLAFSVSDDCDIVAGDDSCTAEVTYSATGSGSQTGVLTIDSNDEDEASVEVSLTGNSIIVNFPEIEVTTTSIDFGSLISGESATETVTIANVGDAVLSLDSITLSGSAFSSTNDCGSALNAGDDCSVEVTYMASGVSSDTGSLVIDSDDSDEGTITVSLEGQSQLAPMPEIVVSTDAIDFGTVVTGSTSVETVVISNTGNADLVIDSIELAGAGASAFTETNDCSVIAAGDDCSVEVTYTADGVSTDMADLIIMSDDSDEPSSIVNLEGTSELEPTPEISLSTNAVSFGNVLPALSAESTVVISNVGSAALTISGIELTGDSEFIQSNDCGTVAAADSCSITLTFTPSAEADFSASVIVTSDDPNSGSMSIQVTGRGQDIGPVLEVSFDLVGDTVIANGKSELELSGILAVVLDTTVGSFTADLSIEPTTATLPLLGVFLSTSADFEFEQVGQTTGTLMNEHLIANSEMFIHLPDVYLHVFGLRFRIAGGEECSTVESVTMTLETPEGRSFNEFGGRLKGNYDLPQLGECGFFSFLATGFMGSSDNSIDIDLTPFR